MPLAGGLGRQINRRLLSRSGDVYCGASVQPVASSNTTVAPAGAGPPLSRCLAMILAPKRRAIASRAFRGPIGFFLFPFLRRAALKVPLRFTLLGHAAGRNGCDCDFKICVVARIEHF